MPRLRTTWLAAILTLCVALLIYPAIAWAHAHLKKSEPAAKATLATAPHEIRLWFTEQPELALTKVTLSDSAGVDVPLGAAERDADGAMAVRVPITGSLIGGVYTVSWKTAAADGDPSSGKFTFRVLADTVAALPIATAPIAPPQAVLTKPLQRALPLPTEDKDTSALTPAFIFVRAVSFGALLAIIGAVAFRAVVLPRAGNLDGSTYGQVTQRIAGFASVASVLFVAAAIARLYIEMQMMSSVAEMDIAHLRTMTMSTSWGAAWQLQVLGALAAFAGFMIARRRTGAGWVLAGMGSVVLAFGTALGGHAGSSERFRTLSLIDDAAHIVGASGWMGSLLWLVVAIGGTARTSAGGRASRVATLVHAFSPTALFFAAIVAITGVVSGWLRLGELAALWSSPYGQMLLIKLAFLLPLAAIGFHNWRQVRPSLGRKEGTVRLRRSATLELSVAVLVVISTAILVAMPTPVTVP